MALDSDIRIKTGFFGHYKTIELQRLAGAEGVIHLLKLWAWSANHRPDGNLQGMTNQEIADVTNWTSGPNKFINAIKTAKFLDGTKYRFTLHDFQEEQAWIQERIKRQKSGRKGAEVTNAKLTPEQKSANAKKANAASQQARKARTVNSTIPDTFTRDAAQKNTVSRNVVSLTKNKKTLKVELNEINDFHAGRRVNDRAEMTENANSVKFREKTQKTQKNQIIKSDTSSDIVILTKHEKRVITLINDSDNLRAENDGFTRPLSCPDLGQGSKEPLSLEQGRKKNTGTRVTDRVSAPGFSGPQEGEAEALVIVLPTGHIISAEQARFRDSVKDEQEPVARASRKAPNTNAPPLPDPLPNQELAQRRLNEFRSSQPPSEKLDKLFALGLEGDTLIVTSNDSDIRCFWLFQNLIDLNERLNRSGVFDCVRLEPR